MKERGKFVDIEGIDGSGKGTQTRAVAEKLRERGFEVETISFPRYKEFWGEKCGSYLSGEDGDVPPNFAFLIFAEDRREASPQINTWLSLGFLVLADRYEPSNEAHQGAKVAPEEREKFIAEVRHVEYERFGIPRPDLVIVLNTFNNHRITICTDIKIQCP